MSNQFKIDEFNKIDADLRKNSLLEASAGTGKTFSLERVVLNLVTDERYDLSIKEILVVTFTNKATREMKERIRALLISEYRTCTDRLIRRRLERAVSEFDEAAIFTIHGFCQNCIQSYPFEIKSGFSTDISEDPGLLEGAVWSFLRDFEDEASEKELGFYRAFSQGKSIPEVVTQLMELYQRDEFKGGVCFLPEVQVSAEIDRTITEFDMNEGELRPLLDVFSGYNSDMLYQAIRAMSCRSQKKTFDKVSNFFSSASKTKTFHEFYDSFYSSEVNKHLVKLSSKHLERKSNKGILVSDVDETSKEIILNTDLLISILEPLYDTGEVEKNRFRNYLAGEFIKLAISRIDMHFKEIQNRQGVLSYHDLIATVHSRVIDKSNRELVEVLRKRFKIALIDEFQDTDKMQWDIFNTIFGESPYHNYFLIGDPKQSIYGFRGADLEIYYKAAKSVPESSSYVLGRNYRSEDGIVDGVNTLFSKVFGQRSNNNTEPVKFSSVESSGKTNREVGESSQNIEFLYYDTEIEPGKQLSASKAKLGYFQNVVKKIVKLINIDSQNPGDIAILVENHKDSLFLRDRLERVNIPVVISRQKNVYKSTEAEDILVFLQLLNRPGSISGIKTVLMSPLFGYSLIEIDEMERSGELEVFSSKCMEWKQNLMESGIIRIWEELERYGIKGHLQERVLAFSGGERVYTNYKHLIEDVSRIQSSERLDSHALYHWLLKMITSSHEDEENSVRLDRDSEAVQIMTMHASKGLEFPIVFFAGAFSKSISRGGVGVKFAGRNGEWFYDLLSNSHNRLLAERDEWEEKKRLYYVAFTRAASRLYLPLFCNSELMVLSALYSTINWDHIKMMIEDRVGDKLLLCEQPIHRQLKIDNPKLSKEIKHALSQEIYDSVSSLTEIHSDTFLINKTLYLEDVGKDIQQEKESIEWNLKELLHRNFHQRFTWVSSYSALTKDSHGSTAKEDADRDDDVTPIVEEVKKSDIITPFNIPGGAKFGDLVHEFFEEIDFELYQLTLEEFLDHDLIDELMLNLGKRHFNLEWIMKFGFETKKMVWNTLNTLLPISDERPKLGTFSDKQRIHEREFYFKVDRPGHLELDGLVLNLEIGYIKGFIDLIMIHNDVLYIADWKTTRIKGPEEYETYNRQNVDKSMKEHHYTLQGLIYCAALYLHQKRVNPHFNYDKDIGGYLYFYVRGMGEGYNTGISYYKPEESEILYFLKHCREDV